ncbi:MAG: hypothetical protein Q9165_003227 [Trypethelium subeluteriae]
MTDPYSHDLRAPSREQLRSRTRSAKYDSFRHTNPGQLGQPHYVGLPSGPFNPFWPAKIPSAQVAALSPRDLYREAQFHRAPPRKHTRSDPVWSRRFEKRVAERRVLRDGCVSGEWREDRRSEWLVEEEDLMMEEFYEWERECLYGERDEDAEAWREIEMERHARNDWRGMVDDALGNWEDRRVRSVEKEGWDVVSEAGSVVGEDEGSSDGWDEEEDFEILERQG